MNYYVYIIASRRDGAIYIGVTNDIVRRIYEHRTKAVPGFSSRYNITQLVWFEIYEDPISAISREKELKKWKRSWKTQSLEAQNPGGADLYKSFCCGPVIPGRFEGPDRRCAISHRGISRFRVRVFDAPRNDVERFMPSPPAAAAPR